jgi:tetratricopeptide (TPR) repeat protein
MQVSRRAPDLGLLLAARAAAAAGQGPGAARAELAVVTILNRLGRRAKAATRAGTALDYARDGVADDTLGEVTAALRIELARCAFDAGPAIAALALLRPVLELRTLAPMVRASALLPAAEALAACGRPGGASAALDAADGLCRHSADADPDDVLLLRGSTCAARARQHRRDGAAGAAETQARAGLELLEELSDPDGDGGECHGRLVLELVLALLDLDAPDLAAGVAESVLVRPRRATTAAPTVWAALALATRVHLPAGQYGRALQLLTDAVRTAERHGHDAALVGCEEALAQLHEERGEFADALRHLRSARAAEHRRRSAVEAVRAVVDEHVPPGWGRVESLEQVAVLVRRKITDTPNRSEAGVVPGRSEAGVVPGRDREADAGDSGTAAELPPEGGRARHRRLNGDRQVPVTELLSTAMLGTTPDAGGGRRRVEHRLPDSDPEKAASALSDDFPEGYGGSAVGSSPPAGEERWRPPAADRRSAARD